jgi:hypothetical protein
MPNFSNFGGGYPFATGGQQYGGYLPTMQAPRPQSTFGFGGPVQGSAGSLTGPSGFNNPGINSIAALSQAPQAPQPQISSAPIRRPYFGSENFHSNYSPAGARPYSNSNFYPQFA